MCLLSLGHNPEAMRHEHGFRDATPVDTARERLFELLEPIDRTVEVDLLQARGRVLATTVTADRDVPHYDRAAMDGWAVRAEETHGATRRSPRTLSVTDDGPVSPGETVRVHTGSPLPEGADAVVMIEDTRTIDDTVEVLDAVAMGRHVGAAGEDVAEDDVVLEAGTTLTPSRLSLLRSVEIDRVTVYERPRVAVIPTGEELVEADPEPGEVIETNGMMVAQYVDDWGGVASYRDIVTDDPEALTEAILADTDADLILTTGGSSVGERDHLPEVVESIGEVVVHGVALQPGHPVGMGHVEGTPLIMLPGYPVSCVVNSVVFARPALERLGRFRSLPSPTVRCELTEKIHSKVGRRTYTRVHLEHGGDGYKATPTMTSGAGILSSIAQTDAIVEVPESVEGYDRGEEIDAVIWE